MHDNNLIDLKSLLQMEKLVIIIVKRRLLQMHQIESAGGKEFTLSLMQTLSNASAAEGFLKTC